MLQQIANSSPLFSCAPLKPYESANNVNDNSLFSIKEHFINKLEKIQERKILEGDKTVTIQKYYEDGTLKQEITYEYFDDERNNIKQKTIKNYFPDGSLEIENLTEYWENTDVLKKNEFIRYNEDGNITFHRIEEHSENGALSKATEYEYTIDENGKSIKSAEIITEYTEDGVNTYKKFFIQPDGKIEDSSQGGIGDCWMLSSLNTLKESPMGRKLIEQTATKTEDGYSFYFKGLDETYFVSNQELNKARAEGIYAKGDPDVILWELAFEKAFMKHEELQGSKAYKYGSSIDGGWFKKFMKVVADEETSTKIIDANTKKGISKAISQLFQNGNYNEIFDKFADKNTDCIGVISFGGDHLITFVDVDGNEHKANGWSADSKDRDSYHAWSIKCADENTVTITNPWDSSDEIVVTREELNRTAYDIDYYVFG